MDTATLDAVHEYIGEVLRERVDPLVARIEQLESQDKKGVTLGYEGVWSDSRRYERGAFVTLAGALWHCDQPTNVGDRPGVARGWTLAVKTPR